LVNGALCPVSKELRKSINAPYLYEYSREFKHESKAALCLIKHRVTKTLGVNIYAFLISAVNGEELSASHFVRSAFWEKDPNTLCIRSWVGLRAGLDSAE
jgi:hypothetical protein